MKRGGLKLSKTILVEKPLTAETAKRKTQSGAKSNFSVFILVSASSRAEGPGILWLFILSVLFIRKAAVYRKNGNVPVKWPVYSI